MLTKQEKKELTKKKAQAYQKEYHKRRAKERKKHPLRSPQEILEEDYAQFLCFMQDCIIPSSEDWTQFHHIYDIYYKYCKAIGQEPEVGVYHFPKLLAKHYPKRTTHKAAYYGLLIRKNIFVRPKDPAPEVNFIKETNHKNPEEE